MIVPSFPALTTQRRVNNRQSQTIAYDANAINATIIAAIGQEPKRGARDVHAWRIQRDRLFNHELDLLRAASGASLSQTITPAPIHENVSPE